MIYTCTKQQQQHRTVLLLMKPTCKPCRKAFRTRNLFFLCIIENLWVSLFRILHLIKSHSFIRVCPSQLSQLIRLISVSVAVYYRRSCNYIDAPKFKAHRCVIEYFTGMLTLSICHLLYMHMLFLMSCKHILQNIFMCIIFVHLWHVMYYIIHLLKPKKVIEWNVENYNWRDNFMKELLYSIL